MKPSRITLTRRHTGRWVLGMGDLELEALSHLLVTAHSVPVDQSSPAELIEAACRLSDCLAKSQIANRRSQMEGSRS